MPRIDFDTVPESDGFDPLPAGTYRMECVAASSATSKAGNEIWNLDLVELESGRHVFDHLVWTPKALGRARDTLSAFGVRGKGEVDYQPEMLMRRHALVTVAIEEWEGKKRNKVAYRGYEPAPKRTTVDGDYVPDDTPF